MMKTLLTLASLVLCTAIVLSQNPEDRRWDTRFDLRGVQVVSYGQTASGSDYPIKCYAESHGSIYAGGSFVNVGSNIARWDTTTHTWYALGDGVNGMVTSICAHDDDIYVAGTFTRAGNIQTLNVARWNISTQQWYTMEGGIDGTVYATAWYNNELYVAGYFSTAGSIAARSIARWNGTTWNGLGKAGENGVVGNVNTLCVYKNNLVVGGSFNSAGGDSTRARLAFWDGSSWHAPPGKLHIANPSQWQYSIRSLRANNSYLFILGNLAVVTVDNINVSNKGVLVYDGQNWKAFEDAFSELSDKVVSFDINDDYFVEFHHADLQQTSIQYSYLDLHTKKHFTSDTLRITNGGYGLSVPLVFLVKSRVLICGPFSRIGDEIFRYAAGYDLQRQSWFALSSEYANGWGPSFTWYEGFPVFLNNNDSLWICGRIPAFGDKLCNGVGLWTGSDWQTYGHGFVDSLKGRNISGFFFISPEISSTCFYKNKLLIGGDFAKIGPTIVNGLFEYSPDTLTMFNGGVRDSSASFSSCGVFAMCPVDTLLYIGGNFISAGSISTRNIMQWNGSRWNRLGLGIDNAGSGTGAHTINTIIRDDSNGIYAAGYFKQAGGQNANSLAHWDGTSWTTPGYDPNDDLATINCMLRVGSDLYVAGSFYRRGGIVVNNIARWDGKQWHDLDGGMISLGTINCMTLVGDQLYVGGNFKAIGRCLANNIARWDLKTNAWYPLGSGTDGEVKSMAHVRDTVFCAGRFDHAGNRLSHNIAAWHPVDFKVEVEDQSNVDAASLLYPNPSDDHLYVHVASLCTTSDDVRIMIYDENGKEMITQSCSPLEQLMRIDTRALHRGLYQCEIQCGQSLVKRQLFIKL